MAKKRIRAFALASSEKMKTHKSPAARAII